MSIKHIFRIAAITFEENYRKKFLYILFFLSLLIVIGAFLFDPFQMGIQIPVLVDMILTGLSTIAIVMTFALFLTAIPNEIEKKTIYPLMAKPINRSDYLWGKYLGNMFMVFINLFVLTILAFFLIKSKSSEFSITIVNAVLLNFIECGILGALITLFSPWMSYPVNLVLTSLFYVFGNISQNYIEYLTTGINLKTFLALFTNFSLPSFISLFPAMAASIALFFRYLLPNFSFLHIKNSVVHSYIVDPNYINGAILYGILYIFILMFLADILFQKKDL